MSVRYSQTFFFLCHSRQATRVGAVPRSSAVCSLVSWHALANSVMALLLRCGTTEDVILIFRGFPLKAKRSKFREKPHLEGEEFTKSSQLVAKTAAEILCHCSYALSAEEKQVGE